MKQFKLKKWVDQNGLKSLLFFAQSLEELLFDHTLDSFKSPALNSHTSLFELKSLLVEFLENRIRKGTLSFSINEAVSNFKNDPVFGEILPTDIAVFIEKLLKNDTDKTDLYHYSNVISEESFKRYSISLFEKLGTAIIAGETYRTIFNLTKTFSTQIEHLGFSRRYAYFKTLNFFFNNKAEPKKIEKLEQIFDFFEYFVAPSQKWKVILRGSSSLKYLKDHAELLDINISFEAPKSLTEILPVARLPGKPEKLPLFIEINNIEARDYVRASEEAYDRLELFESICRFHNHKHKLFYHLVSVAYDENTKTPHFIKPTPHPMKCGGEKIQRVDVVDIRESIDLLDATHFDQYSSYMFTKVLNYHRAALDTNRLENQLFNLWSSLEGFLPPPTGDKDRIDHYINLLVPPLTLSYPEKIFRYISKNLYMEENSKEIINKSTNSGDFFLKTIAILVSEDFEDKRKELFEAISDYPLLHFRCNWCYTHFHSNNSIKSLYKNRIERIGWHIQRIYTTRNQVVHNANAYPYLRTLIENLHTYLDTLINSVIRMAVNSDYQISISSAAKKMTLYSDILLKDLETKKTNCNIENHLELIFGKNNPLIPFSILKK